MNKLRFNSGYSLMEALIALMLAGMVATAATSFYLNQHNNMLTQHDISDVQQNLRASVNEITLAIRNAGANLPDGIAAFESANTDPDTLKIRYAVMGGSIAVGEHTQKRQASPIHVDEGTDLSGFTEGQSVYFWYSARQTGEWFTVTKIAINSGSGWEELHHQGQGLLFDPMPGDYVVNLQESQYYIDNTVADHPTLIKVANNGTPQAFAENIEDLQLKYYLSNNDTVDVLAAGDTVFAVDITMSGHTENKDHELADRDQNSDGYRRRSLSTEVVVRNSRF